MKYNELKKLSLEDIQDFVKINPGHIAGQNALRQIECDEKQERALERMGREKPSRTDGLTHVRRNGKCPRKRDLK